MSPSIFINYRRDDASAEALLVRKSLIDRFGAGNVFMDVTSIDPGAAWPEGIEAKLKASSVVIAVIGPNWLRAGSDEWGRRRIDEASDWVRRELESALASGKQVIPLFVGGAKAQIPAPVLPATLQALSNLQGISIRREYWDHDIQLLLASLATKESGESPQPRLDSPFPVSTLIPPDKLSEAKLAAVLKQDLPRWTLVRSPVPEQPQTTREELFRELRFQSFVDAIGFMEQVAPGCDIAHHHPRWENIFKVVRVYLSTWDGGLHAVSDRDVQLARYFDQAYADFPGKAKPRKLDAAAPLLRGDVGSG